MVDIISTHVEEIFQKFKGHLPPPAVEVIINMHEEMRMLQRSVNDQLNLINTLREALVASTQLSKMMAGKIKQFEQKYSDNYQDMLKDEDIN